MTDPIEAILQGDPELSEALDLYAADATGSPSRSELVMRILRDWLITNGYLRSDPLDALSVDADKPAL